MNGARWNQGLPPAAPCIARVIHQVNVAGVVPLDPWHLAALLEMEGWNDSVARQHGYPDLFALARAAQPEVVRVLTPCTVRTTAPVQRFHSLRHFGRGMARSAPMLLAVSVALLASPDTAPVAAGAARCVIAMWGSFLLTGGFHQVIVSRGRSLAEFGQHRLALRSTFRSATAGLLATLAVSLLLLFLTDSWVAALYGSLSLLWLSVAVLTLADWLAPYLAGLSLFCAGVWAGHLLLGPALSAVVTGVPGLVAFSLGLAAVNLIAGFRRLRKLAAEKGGAATLPAVPGRSLLPQFLYGSLFFLFLLADRFLIWLQALRAPSAAPAVAYEAGLIWAGLVFALAAGGSEVAIQRVIAALYQATTRLDAVGKSDRLVRLWLQGQAGLLAWLALSAAAVCGAITLAAPDMFASAGNVRFQAFATGVIGYSLLAGGLFHLAVLSAANQHGPALKTMLLAAGTNMACGLAGIPGFAAGALLLWLAGGWQCYRTLKRAHFVLYANA